MNGSEASVIAGRGVAAAGHADAARVAVDVLRAGGNVVDAIVAGAFAAFVVEPAMCGAGGHGRLSLIRAGTAEPWGIDHFLVAPRAATPAAYAEALRTMARRHPGCDAGALAETGPLSVGVPGAVAGLCEAVRRFGSWPLARLVGPAIDLAEAGIVLDTRHAALVALHADTIRTQPVLAAWLMPHGALPAPGARLDGHDLARTLRRIAAEGAAALHDGPIARAIEQAVAGAGGLLDAADLAAYRPRVVRQVEQSYRDLRYVTCDDLIAVEALNILERFDLVRADEATVLHLLAEALAQAFVDNFAFGGDPLNAALPLAGLASKDYARERAATIAATRVRTAVTPGEPWRFGAVGTGVPPFAGTTQICVLDVAGNGASLITSIDSAFGSMVLVPGTGVLLGNGLQLFGLFPDGRNPMAPGRMPLYGAPVFLAMDERGASGALAGAGGYRIATGILNTLVQIVDRGLPLAEAIERPRVHHQGVGLEVADDMAAATHETLEGLGHSTTIARRTVTSWPFARTSGVWRDKRGDLHAASGPSCGAASGWG
jgi:gamma-glutamyltranspeptidase/glutathione hydrolase